MNDNDKASRYLIKRDPVGCFRWMLGQPSVDFHAWIDSRRIVLPNQRDLTHDLIAAFQVGDTLEALCIELQSESASDTAARLLYGYIPRVAHESSGLSLSAVGGIVVNLTGPTQPDSISHRPTLMPSCRFEGQIGQITLRDESASRLLAELASGGASVWLLAWLPLMQGGVESATIEGWKRHALTLSDERDRGILVTLTLTFATLAGRLPTWAKQLEGWGMSKNPYLESIRDEVRVEARKEGKAEGLAEGLAEGVAVGLAEGRITEAKSFLATLGRRKFGKAATKKQQGELDGITDLARLERMRDRLLDATSWSDLLATA